MLLRTRISLLVILAFAVICIGLTLASLKREDLLRVQYTGATTVDRSNLWQKINASLLLRMEDKAWIAAEDEALRRAVHTGDQDGVQRLGTVITARLRDQGIADRFDVLYADGTLAYSSHAAVFQSSIITTRAAQDAMVQGVRIRGTGNDQQRNVSLVLGIPLSAPAGAIGIAAAEHISPNRARSPLFRTRRRPQSIRSRMKVSASVQRTTVGPTAPSAHAT